MTELIEVPMSVVAKACARLGVEPPTDSTDQIRAKMYAKGDFRKLKLA